MATQSDLERITGRIHNLSEYFAVTYLTLIEKRERTIRVTQSERQELVQIMKIVQNEELNSFHMAPKIRRVRRIINYQMGTVIPEWIKTEWNIILDEEENNNNELQRAVYDRLQRGSNQLNGTRHTVTEDERLDTQRFSFQPQEGMQLPPIPTQEDNATTLRTGNVVYIIEPTLHQYQELTINGKDGRTIHMLPTIANNLTNQSSMYKVTEDKLEKAQQVTKRKFILNKDFGKYKKGTVFSRKQLVREFSKFQLAKNIYLYNKLYTCAE